nr:MAG TPA: hypothetical protein [Bacteriophage sp.]
MFQNSRGKSVLHDLDFSKLEERLIAHAGIHDSVDVTVSKFDLMNLENTLSKMKQTLANGWTGRQVFVETYISPEPHLKSKVDRIIDKFWLNPCGDDTQLYLAQIQKNPRTKDVFKGKSTTHHYPWYRRGSKY